MLVQWVPEGDGVRSERAQSGTWGTSAVKGGWEKSYHGKGSRKPLRDRKNKIHKGGILRRVSPSQEHLACGHVGKSS